MKKRKSSFNVQGSILAAAAITCGGIGLLYQILLMNRIGAQGIGYYSSAFRIYSVLIILSSYSLPLAVSKMISTRITGKEYKNAYSVFLTAFLIGAAGGLIIGFLIYFGAGFYASAILKRPMAAYALRALAPVAALSAVLGILRGYFQGLGTAIPTGISLAAEHGITAITGFIFSFSFFRSGVDSGIVFGKEDFPGAFGAAGGILGTGVGAFISLLFLGFIYTIYKRVMQKKIRKDQTGVTESYLDLSKDFMIAAVPVVLSVFIYQLNLLIDDALFGNVMAFFKVSAMDTASVWGEYAGKYQSLVFFPTMIASIAGILKMNSLNRLDKELDRGLITERIGAGIRAGMLLAIPFAIGLTILSNPLMNILFNGDNVKAINMLFFGAVAVVFFTLAFITCKALYSLEYGKNAVRHGIFSLLIHTVVLVFMLFALKGNIYGVAFSNILYGVLVFLFNWITLIRKVKYGQELKKTYSLPLVAAVIMGAVMAAVYYLLFKVTSLGVLSVLLSIFIGGSCYLALILKFKCIDEYELYDAPGGRWLVNIGKKVHLL